MDDLTILLGGLAGENVLLNDITTGASSDIDKAYDLIYNMMNVGAFGFEYYKREKRSYTDVVESSNDALKKREEKIAEILNECLSRGQTIIENNKHIYNLLIDELLVERRLSSERINQILTNINN